MTCLQFLHHPERAAASQDAHKPVDRTAIMCQFSTHVGEWRHVLQCTAIYCTRCRSWSRLGCDIGDILQPTSACKMPRFDFLASEADVADNVFHRILISTSFLPTVAPESSLTSASPVGEFSFVLYCLDFAH